MMPSELRKAVWLWSNAHQLGGVPARLSLVRRAWAQQSVGYRSLQGAAAEAAQAVEKAGGCVVGFYKDPLAGHPILLAISAHRCD
jgi:hypothetical protein